MPEGGHTTLGVLVPSMSSASAPDSSAISFFYLLKRIHLSLLYLIMVVHTEECGLVTESWREVSAYSEEIIHLREAQHMDQHYLAAQISKKQWD